MLLEEVGEARTPHAAYVWYCAGEAELGVDRGPSARFASAKAAELAELSGASFVTGVAGTSKASIDARLCDPLVAAEDYRRLIVHWRRAGMWSTQWTMLRSIAGLLYRLGRPYEAAVLTGSILATHAGHRIFGDDEAALAELGRRLREALGDESYEVALGAGRGAHRRRRRGARPAGAALSRAAPRRSHHLGCSARTPRTALPTSSWVRASLPGWKPPQRTSR